MSFDREQITRALSESGCERKCGTGFSREDVRRHAAKFRAYIRSSSRLKPDPLKQRRMPNVSLGSDLHIHRQWFHFRQFQRDAERDQQQQANEGADAIPACVVPEHAAACPGNT